MECVGYRGQGIPGMGGARPFRERSKIAGRPAQILLEKKEELARLATLETGKKNRGESRRCGTQRFHRAVLRGQGRVAEFSLAPTPERDRLHESMFRHELPEPELGLIDARRQKSFLAPHGKTQDRVFPY